MEAAFMLQKIEEYTGIVILATNYQQNIDEAFKRRIKFLIDFPFPDIEYRKKLWKKAFPDKLPLSDNVDYDFLAGHFELSGSNIRNVVLNAAFLAAAKEDEVDMSHIIKAVVNAFTKSGKKLSKEVNLVILGQETEVDKNIIEHISDPLMHLIRNSVDHGLETTEVRIKAGKTAAGTITLEAKNAGSDVLIIVRDDGKGLNKEKILKRARENNLLYKNEEDMTEKEIFNLILLPGFSTKDKVTEFSGRGVGMDVVSKNIETVGGSLTVDSVQDKGVVILKIPLTLAIIDGMNVKVGNSRYTIPIISIKESFRPKDQDIFTDPDILRLTNLK
jgi:phosphoribosyl-ATP pyrophosphohydrolase